ncbi:protein of unknown function [Candidatus Promineifilum breve]|uniref:Uncharacterized protein n=1 Tax=Candidatus Promineifilum breve TaxID=1806508 RepID=A0A160T4V2_9CHLR|nr:hypothetical protein [Candidatus Promineifilum breve]CUS03680.2 protein of unknown function [Candidatus Promineifilum breve]
MNRPKQKATFAASDLKGTFSPYRQDDTWQMPQGKSESSAPPSNKRPIRDDLRRLDGAIKAVKQADTATFDKSKKAALSLALKNLRDQVKPLNKAQQKAVENIVNFIGTLVEMVAQPNPNSQKIVQAMVESLRKNISTQTFDPPAIKDAIEEVLEAIPSV